MLLHDTKGGGDDIFEIFDTEQLLKYHVMRYDEVSLWWFKVRDEHDNLLFSRQQQLRFVKLFCAELKEQHGDNKLSMVAVFALEDFIKEAVNA